MRRKKETREMRKTDEERKIRERQGEQKRGRGTNIIENRGEKEEQKENTKGRKRKE
jgi:hypothetical protein